jgi:Protein of unknown function (DUF4054)
MATPPTITEQQFRAIFPEFADRNTYLSAAVQFWLTNAQAQINYDAWLNSYAEGVYLFTAHQLKVAGNAAKKAAAGGASGPVASKTVGSVSVSYDTASTAEDGAGFWNLSNYGKRYWRLVKLFGAGAIQL